MAPVAYLCKLLFSLFVILLFSFIVINVLKNRLLKINIYIYNVSYFRNIFLYSLDMKCSGHYINSCVDEYKDLSSLVLVNERSTAHYKHEYRNYFCNDIILYYYPHVKSWRFVTSRICHIWI